MNLDFFIGNMKNHGKVQINRSLLREQNYNITYKNEVENWEGFSNFLDKSE